MCSLCIRIFVFLSCLCSQVYSSHTHHVVCRYWHTMYTGDNNICPRDTVWQRDSVTAWQRVTEQNIVIWPAADPPPHHITISHGSCTTTAAHWTQTLGLFRFPCLHEWSMLWSDGAGGGWRRMGTPMAPYYWIESRNRNMMMGEHLAHHFPNFLATYLIFWSGSRSGSV